MAMTVVAVVFPMGGKWFVHRGVGNTVLPTRGGASRGGQYSVANVSVGDVIKKPAVERKREGDNPYTGEEPSNSHT